MIHPVRSVPFVLCLLAASGCGAPDDEPGAAPSAPPAAETTGDFDQPGDTRTSALGRYRVTLEPLAAPIPLRRIHQWRVSVADATGKPADAVRLELGGGMPAHDHGFPTSPVIAEPLEPGVFIVEGVKFNMIGWWRFRFDIRHADGLDTVAFNYQIEE